MARTREKAVGGRVRLLVPMPPWRLAWMLEPVELSPAGLTAVCRRPAPGLAALAEGGGLLQEGDPCELQIEPPGEGLPACGVRARLTKATAGAGGIELAFRFTDPGPELIELLAAHASGERP